ncbi:MAG TPA: hypothetical protein PKO06_19765 [Candidatus Ozemobacteraceae bacterium]|nr:hypothetical protein [Candidatus Ozemobacteraceae bacterium]
MRKPLSIAGVTWLQGLRNQTFWIAAFLFAAFLLVAFFLRVLAIGHKAMMLRSFGLASMELSALLLIVYGFVFSMHRERENRIQSLYLTYVSPWQYLLGKLLGNCLLIFAYLSIAAFLCAALLFHEGAFSGAFFFGTYSIFLKLCIICSFCLLFSCLLSSPVFASLMTFFTYCAGELSAYPLMIMKSSTNQMIVTFYRVLYHLLPNMDKVDLKYLAIWELPIEPMHVLTITVYAFFYSMMLFVPALWAFSRREH